MRNQDDARKAAFNAGFHDRGVSPMTSHYGAYQKGKAASEVARVGGEAFGLGLGWLLVAGAMLTTLVFYVLALLIWPVVTCTGAACVSFVSRRWRVLGGSLSVRDSLRLSAKASLWSLFVVSTLGGLMAFIGGASVPPSFFFQIIIGFLALHVYVHVLRTSTGALKGGTGYFCGVVLWFVAFHLPSSAVSMLISAFLEGVPPVQWSG